MITIRDCRDEIREEIELANPHRPDYRTDVEVERLRKWLELLERILELTQLVEKIGLPQPVVDGWRPDPPRDGAPGDAGESTHPTNIAQQFYEENKERARREREGSDG